MIMQIISTLSVLFLSQLVYAQSTIRFFSQPILASEWVYVEGEKGSYTDKREIRNILAAKMDGFENPYCLRDTLFK